MRSTRCVVAVESASRFRVEADTLQFKPQRCTRVLSVRWCAEENHATGPKFNRSSKLRRCGRALALSASCHQHNRTQYKTTFTKKTSHHHSQHSHKKTHRMLSIVKHTSAGLGTHRHCLASKRYDVDRCVGGVRQRVVLGHVLAPSGGVLC